MNLNEFRQKATNMQMAISGETKQEETKKQIRFSNAELVIYIPGLGSRVLENVTYNEGLNELVLFF